MDFLQQQGRRRFGRTCILGLRAGDILDGVDGGLENSHSLASASITSQNPEWSGRNSVMVQENVQLSMRITLIQPPSVKSVTAPHMATTAHGIGNKWAIERADCASVGTISLHSEQLA